MNENIIIFGASGGGEKVAKTFQSLGICFEGFVDNSEKTWGKTLLGKLIENPKNLTKKNCRVVIASEEHQEEIEEQLDYLGIKETLILKEELILEAINNRMQEFHNVQVNKQSKNDECIIFMDLLEGMKLGGIENWVTTVVKGFNLSKTNIKLITNSANHVEDDIQKNLLLVDSKYEDFWKGTVELVKVLAQNRPCCLLINKMTQLFYAGYIAKILFGKDIKMIAMVHSDAIVHYRRISWIEKYLDGIMCVSGKIKRTFCESYHISENKLFFKESPVPLGKEKEKENKDSGRDIPIKIAYAGRLQKGKKRADLLLLFFRKLELRNISYKVSIAGDGPLYINMKKELENLKSSGKIKMLGQLSPLEMEHFWKEQDIYISVSDAEGSSIAMLEAMAYGVVPVVTCVSGVDDIIMQGINGYYGAVGDLDYLVSVVEKLELDREELKKIGHNAYTTIEKQCKTEDYITYLETFCI